MVTIKREDTAAGHVDLSDVREPRSKRLAPIHAGEILQGEFLEPIKLSAYRLAKDTGMAIARVAILGSDRTITADTALRLGRFFGTTPEFWLGLQERYDLDLARANIGHRLAKEVRPLTAA